MTDDELADHFKDGFDALHARIASETDPVRKRKATRLVNLMHGAANGLKELAEEDGLIQPFSGGDPKPE